MMKIEKYSIGVGDRFAHQARAQLRACLMAAEAGRCMAIHFRSTAAEKLSTPAHLRVVLAREGRVLQLRIPKRRGPPLAFPISITAGWQPRLGTDPNSSANWPSQPHRPTKLGSVPARAFAVVR